MVMHAQVTIPPSVSQVGYPHILHNGWTKAWCSPYLGFKHDKPMTIFDDKVTCKRCLKLIEKEDCNR